MYDADDNVIATTDPLDHTTTYVYDALNRQVESIDALGGITTDLYDAVGNETGLIDPDLNRTTFIYDALNRKVEEINPLDETTTYVYDALDRLTSTTDALGQIDRVLLRRRQPPDRRDLARLEPRHGQHPDLYLRRRWQPAHRPDQSGTYTMTYDALDRVIPTRTRSG